MLPRPTPWTRPGSRSTAAAPARAAPLSARGPRSDRLLPAAGRGRVSVAQPRRRDGRPSRVDQAAARPCAQGRRPSGEGGPAVPRGPTRRGPPTRRRQHRPQPGSRPRRGAQPGPYPSGGPPRGRAWPAAAASGTAPAPLRPPPGAPPRPRRRPARRAAPGRAACRAASATRPKRAPWSHAASTTSSHTARVRATTSSAVRAAGPSLRACACAAATASAAAKQHHGRGTGRDQQRRACRRTGVPDPACRPAARLRAVRHRTGHPRDVLPARRVLSGTVPPRTAPAEAARRGRRRAGSSAAGARGRVYSGAEARRRGLEAGPAHTLEVQLRPGAARRGCPPTRCRPPSSCPA